VIFLCDGYVIKNIGKEEYDKFKQRLKDWKETNPDEYDLFEEEMNRKDASGYQKIMNLAVVLVPL
jgi:transketolase